MVVTGHTVLMFFPQGNAVEDLIKDICVAIKVPEISMLAKNCRLLTAQECNALYSVRPLIQTTAPYERLCLTIGSNKSIKVNPR